MWSFQIGLYLLPLAIKSSLKKISGLIAGRKNLLCGPRAEHERHFWQPWCLEAT